MFIYDESKAAVAAYNVTEFLEGKAYLNLSRDGMDADLYLDHAGQIQSGTAEAERRLLAALSGEDPAALHLSAAGQKMIDLANGGRVAPGAKAGDTASAERAPTDEETTRLCKSYMAALEEKGNAAPGSTQQATARVNELADRLRSALRARAASGCRGNPAGQPA